MIKSSSAAAAVILQILAVVSSGFARGHSTPSPTPTPGPSAPPAPTLVAPANGASLVQPITLNWNSVSGPINSYTWQVGTTSNFTTVALSGFTEIDNDPTVPIPTSANVSGLPNGTFFWRVKATTSVDSPWSVVRSFTVTGIGSAPAAPTLTTPANGAQFHILEFFKIQWTAVTGAHYYLLEVASEPTFSFPLTLTSNPVVFGTNASGGWGNALTAYYRVRAVSIDGVRSLPSSTVAVQITDSAPVSPAVSLLAPANGATVATPFVVHWSDTPNPQIPGYDVEFSTSSTFDPGASALSIPGASRSDYLITGDLLPPGTYFWHVSTLQGDVSGPFSAARTVTVTAGPTPPNVNLFAILTEPINAYTGNSGHARVILDNPAPAGGAVVWLGTDIPAAQMPSTTVTVPAGQTDAIVSPITTGPFPSSGGAMSMIGDLLAGFSTGHQQSSLGLLPILDATGLSNQTIVGGNSFTATITLQSAAPSGGTTVRFISSNTSLVNPPATVAIPAGATGTTVTIPTNPVSVPTRVTIITGTDRDGDQAPLNSIVLTPPGGPTPPASLSSLTLNPAAVPVGGTATVTLTLTAPAPSGGAVVSVSGSLEGQVILPVSSVTIPVGNTTATFQTVPAPETTVTRWAVIQGSYGTWGGMQASTLAVDPGPGAPTLFAIGPASQDVIGGHPARGTVCLVMPAPSGGAVVNVTTDNPSIIQVPSSVSVPEGNSAVSFTINTQPVSINPSGGNVFASAGGVTKSIFITVNPDPNAPPILQAVTVNPTSVVGGTNATGTVLLNSPAPTGGVEATLETSGPQASAPGVVTVPAGQTSVSFTITTLAVNSNTVVTVTAIVGNTSQSANLTLTGGGGG